MLFFCLEPKSRLALFSDRFASEFIHFGLPASFRRTGSVLLSRIVSRWIPGTAGHWLASSINSRLFCNRFFSEVSADDTVVLYATLGDLSDTSENCLLAKIKQKGAKLIVLMQDAWPIASPLHKSICRTCIRYADAIGCVTPNLVSLFIDHYPQSVVFLMEEAIDVNAFHPSFSRNEPTIVWSGPPHKTQEVYRMIPVLESVFEKKYFRLRIVSGTKPPAIESKIPVDWIPFSEDYQMAFQPASIAFAQYQDTPYGRCKGNYKIKTYLAAGCSIVTNPVGYNFELVKSGINGLFAETPEEWEAAFLRLLRNPEERLAMRKASRELAVRRFSYSAIARQYAGVLRRLGVESRPVTK